MIAKKLDERNVLSASARQVGTVQRGLSRNECLHQLFESSVDLHPHRLAVDIKGDALSYRDLDERANQLARALLDLGVGVGDSVGILLERTSAMYVAILGVLKSGAAYVPLDASYPSDRVQFILSDAGAAVVITTRELASRQPLPGRTLAIDADAPLITKQRTARLRPQETGVGPDDLAYLIYTSGSTGRPKGVQVEHRNICHWVRAAQTVYQLTPADRVYQGFSLAFDASLEEIWIAWSNGATLVPATAAVSRAGPELPAWLAAAGVTVLSCVPTLVSMFSDEIPSMRLLIFGGETCPQSLAQRWCKPGRRVLNTYGPTEATVTASFAECRADGPVTIGRPMANYVLYLLDELRNPVAAGDVGELFIGGPGVARGYVNRPDLERARFLPNPFEEDRAVAPRIYRTGDLVRLTDNGDLQFAGRADDQVKIRGFRIELSEIEAQILAVPRVRATAVAVKEIVAGIDSIVAYVVPEASGGTVDLSAIDSALRSKVPAYMVPAAYEVLPELPTLPSGKVDRKALPVPSQILGPQQADIVNPRSDVERTIASVFAEVLRRDAVSVTSDFFLDLGGHSLFAALAASKLRALPGLGGVSVSDIYRHPTVESLAKAIAQVAESPKAREEPSAEPKVAPASSRRRRLTAALQAVGVYTIQLLVFYPLLLLAWAWSGGGVSPFTLGVLAAVAAVTYFPMMLGISLAVKWTVIGRYRPGRYPLWGGYYLRWWIVRHVSALVPVQWIAGTPLMPAYCRLMGAKVGRDVHIDTVFMQAYDVLSIGDRTSINLDAQLVGYTVEDGALVIAPISIGSDCFVGSHSVVSPGARLQDGATLAEHSLLEAGWQIPSGEFWQGSPASRVESPPSAQYFGGHDRTAAPSRPRRAAVSLGHLVGACLLALVPLAASMPGAWLLMSLVGTYGYWTLLASPLAAFLFIGTFCLETALIKWLLLGRVKEGWYPLYSGFYLRKWFVDRVLHLNFVFLNSLFSTLYALAYFRLLGAHMGPNAEVERVSHVSPDLLTLKPGSFIADAVYLGAPRVARGRLLVGTTQVGERTFIGNSALLPAQSTVADGCLVAVQSVPPEGAPPGTSWLGSPPLVLPRRDINRSFTETQTFAPTRRLRAARYFVEFFRVTVPTTLFTFMMLGTFLVTSTLAAILPVLAVLALFPIVLLASQFTALFMAVGVKLLAIGRYRPTVSPLWSMFVWRSELVTGVYEGPAAQVLLLALTGTPFIRSLWRLFGVKVGKRVFVDTTHVTEFDLVRIDDEAALNLNCGAQTHLFEDRVMKMSFLHIGPGCSVGSNSIVLYDTTMHPGSKLGSLSLLMKGESLPAQTQWAGIPAQRVVARAGSVAP